MSVDEIYLWEYVSWEKSPESRIFGKTNTGWWEWVRNEDEILEGNWEETVQEARWKPGENYIPKTNTGEFQKELGQHCQNLQKDWKGS